MRMKKYKSKGFASIAALILVVIFTILACEFLISSRISMETAVNHRNMSSAQAAAESGLNYAHFLICDYLNMSAVKTFNQTLSYVDSNNAFEALADYLQTKMTYSPLLDTKTIDPLGEFQDQYGYGMQIIIPAITFLGDEDYSSSPSSFSLKFRLYALDMQNLVIMSTGQSEDLTRTVEVSYSMSRDQSILDYTIASRSRIIITGDSTIEGGIFSEWEDHNLAAPISLAGDSTINGDINTILSETNYDQSVLQGAFEEIIYDQPKIVWPTIDDFDTSWYEDQTSTLSVGLKSYKTKEYYPHAPGDYTLPYDASSAELNRTVYENKVLDDILLPSGSNALFINCTFKGVMFVKGGIGVNNIRFEDCTFEGVIATGETPKFDEETWKKNLLYFTGSTMFSNQFMEDITILAPNYNINIGNTHVEEDGSSTTITGMVLGGVVDLRGNINLQGTIISMGEVSEELFGSDADQVATNIGFSDESPEAGGDPAGTIDVIPPENNNLPIGFATRIMFNREANSYVER